MHLRRLQLLGLHRTPNTSKNNTRLCNNNEYSKVVLCRVCGLRAKGRMKVLQHLQKFWYGYRTHESLAYRVKVYTSSGRCWNSSLEISCSLFQTWVQEPQNSKRASSLTVCLVAGLIDTGDLLYLELVQDKLKFCSPQTPDAIKARYMIPGTYLYPSPVAW